ncbi:hypothetical protein B0H11DRAFT_1942736 [Mycena galericulata]|nr:hypothetical protein B0H11DRAFT_1942736 [Mycena galericulata]
MAETSTPTSSPFCPASSLLHATFVVRIIKNAYQQASIFLQKKSKCDLDERAGIVDMLCAHGGKMIDHIVDLTTDCYSCHILQKMLDCEEEVRPLIISELLMNNSAQTLVDKHASHVWGKGSGVVGMPRDGVMQVSCSCSLVCYQRCSHPFENLVGWGACCIAFLRDIHSHFNHEPRC